MDDKGEERNVYEVSESDLVKVDRCNLCNSKNVSLISEVFLEGRLNFLSTSVCNDCLFTFRSISPSFSWFKKCWRQIATNKLEVFNPEAEALRKSRYEYYYETLAKYVNGNRLLELGASYGTGAKVFQDRGFDVSVVESEDDRANYLRHFRHFPLAADSIEEMATKTADYDVITFVHCLEHLDDPAFVAAGVRNLINEDAGILYLEVPNVWYHVTWNDAFYLAHKSNFTEANVVDLFRRNRFEVIEKIWPWDDEQQVWHLGLVLKPVNGNDSAEREPLGDDAKTADDIRRLYRKGFPLEPVPPLDSVIKYSVPFIEQFYQTLKIDTKEITKDSEFVSFRQI